MRSLILQDHFDAGEVDPEIADQPLYLTQPVDVGRRVEADIAPLPRGLDEAYALVMAQRLRVDADHLRATLMT